MGRQAHVQLEGQVSPSDKKKRVKNGFKRSLFQISALLIMDVYLVALTELSKACPQRTQMLGHVENVLAIKWYSSI